MIRVTRVIGETYDLETGRESGKLLVLTNGQDEVSIPISDEDLMAVIGLVQKGDEPHPEDRAVPEQYQEYVEQSMARQDTPPMPDDDEPGELHGDEYDDMLTGTASI